MNYVETPNLPFGKVSFAAISEDAQDIIDVLNGAQIGTLNIEKCSELPDGISSHADLRIIHLGGPKVICSSLDNKEKDLLKLSGFSVDTANELSWEYPEDCLLNCAIIGKFIVMNEKAADSKLLEYAEKKEMQIINVKQGYSKCSTLIVDRDAAITADKGIAEALEKNDIEVLKINPGNIYLKGYDTGFIGGVGGMIEKSILGTAGNLNCLKKDGDNIISFLRNRNIYYENLGRKELRDIGGIIPLCEDL